MLALIGLDCFVVVTTTTDDVFSFSLRKVVPWDVGDCGFFLPAVLGSVYSSIAIGAGKT